LQKPNPQNDFLDNVAAKVHSGDISQEEMAAHSWNMSLAGGETTGTSMAATTFYILKTPGVQEKLRHEVRTAFKSFEDIDFASAMQLPYLMAVLKEGGRIFPTAPQGTPRESPGVTIDGHYVPAGVSRCCDTW
jgi:cytochrome P450